MAKRQRGSARPGQRRPAKSPTGRPLATTTPPPPQPRPAGLLSDDELARAAALEASIVGDERQPGASLAQGRDRRRGAAVEVPARGRSRTVTTLAAVAADEYIYVQRDLRRIVVVFVGIFAILFAAFIVTQLAGISRVG